jgi:hypothetical protein
MKRKNLFITGVLVLALVFGFVLAGCDNGNNGGGGGGGGGPSIPSLSNPSISGLSSVTFNVSAVNYTEAEFEMVVPEFAMFLWTTYQMVYMGFFESVTQNGPFNINASTLSSPYFSNFGITGLAGSATGSINGLNTDRGSVSFQSNNVSYKIDAVDPEAQNNFIKATKVNFVVSGSQTWNNPSESIEQSGGISAAVAFQMEDEETGTIYGGKASMSIGIAVGVTNNINSGIGSYTTEPAVRITASLYQMDGTLIKTETYNLTKPQAEGFFGVDGPADYFLGGD